jgi:hypothetical protein
MVPTYLFVCLFVASLKKSGLVLLMNSVVCVGIQVSAFRKITEPSSCADQPSNISASGLQELSSPIEIYAQKRVQVSWKQAIQFFEIIKSDRKY